MSIFKLDNIGYTYDNSKVEVLKDISYEFDEGKTYAVIGRSGSGKTTLLSIMAGLDNPKKGKVIYKGKDIRGINKDKYRSKHIGVVFQSFNLLPHLTAVENVILSMDIAGVKIRNKKEHAFEILDKVGIDIDKAKRRVLMLSGGEQQRVAIARSLAYNPDVILADEPTGNLDKHTETGVMDIFKKLAKEENKCIIIVTHSGEVAKVVDEIYNLEKKEKNEAIVY